MLTITTDSHLTPLVRGMAVLEMTRQERVVLGLMAEGHTNQLIAERLVVSRRTVETHVGRIFRKLNLWPSDDENRRVCAVLAYLAAAGVELPRGAVTDC